MVVVDPAHHHAHIGKQRIEIAAGDVAEAFEQHRARPHLSPFECLQLASRADLGLRLHCRDHDDVVVDLGLDLAPAQPEPFGDLERLDVPAAPVETYLAEIVERRLDLDAQHAAPAVRRTDLRMRQLHEVRVLEHRVERGHEIGIGAFERRVVQRRMRRDLGVEIVIVAAQALERREILVVIDRGDHRAQPSEFFPLGVVGKSAVRDQRLKNVALAHRNEPVVGGVAPGLPRNVAHGGGYIVRASAVKALRDCGSM